LFARCRSQVACGRLASPGGKTCVPHSQGRARVVRGHAAFDEAGRTFHCGRSATAIAGGCFECLHSAHCGHPAASQAVTLSSRAEVRHSLENDLTQSKDPYLPTTASTDSPMPAEKQPLS